MYQQRLIPDKEIQVSGCYFCSCLQIAEQVTNVKFDFNDILSVKDYAITRGILGPGCFVRAPDALITLAMRALGNSHQSVVFKKKIFTVKEAVGGYFIQRVKQPEGSLFDYHFRVVNKKLRILYDPDTRVKGFPEYENMYWLYDGHQHGF